MKLSKEIFFSSVVMKRVYKKTTKQDEPTGPRQSLLAAESVANLS